MYLRSAVIVSVGPFVLYFFLIFISIPCAMPQSNVRKVFGRVMCKETEISMWPLGTNYTECLTCLICPRGQGPTHPCGTVVKTSEELKIPYICQRCVKGKTYSTSKSDSSCRPCTICQKNRDVKSECTRRKDRECGKCKVGYYEHKDVYGYKSCDKCSRCCGDGNDIIENECVRQGLPSDKVCSYSDIQRCQYKDQPANLPTTETTAINSRVPANAIINDTSGDMVVRVQPSKSNTNNGNPTIYAAILLPTLLILLLLVVVFAVIFRFRRTRSPGNEAEKPFEPSAGSQENRNDSDTEAETQQEEFPEQIGCSGQSTKLYSYLRAPNTYIRRVIDRICNIINSIDKHDFESICIRLGVPEDEVFMYRTSKGHGDFRSVLKFLSDNKLELTLENIAKECQDYNSRVAELLRKEDRDHECQRLEKIENEAGTDSDREDISAETPTETKVQVSTKLAKYVEDPNTYKRKKFDIIRHCISALRSNDFENICISLGTEKDVVYSFQGNFQNAIDKLITHDRELTLEDLAEVCGRYHPRVAQMIRQEDLLLERERMEKEAEMNAEN